MKTLILTYKEVEKLLSMSETTEDVEAAFRALGEGKATVPDTRIFHNFGEDLTWVYAVAGSYQERGIMALKSLTLNWNNPSKRNVPALYGTISLCDIVSGFPFALMDSFLISYARSGGIAGVGAKYLARKDSKVIGIIGSRDLARYSLMSIKQVIPRLKKAYVYSKTEKNRKAFADEMAPIVKMKIEAVSNPDDAVKGMDIVIGASNADEPIIFEKNVRPGTYVAGMGSKHEVEPSLLKKAKVVVETLEECRVIGKIGVAIRKKVITEEHVHAELADVVTGKKPGRTSRNEVTLIDSIGLAVEDLVVADRIYRKAKRQKIGTWSGMWEGIRVW